MNFSGNNFLKFLFLTISSCVYLSQKYSAFFSYFCFDKFSLVYAVQSPRHCTFDCTKKFILQKIKIYTKIFYIHSINVRSLAKKKKILQFFLNTFFSFWLCRFKRKEKIKEKWFSIRGTDLTDWMRLLFFLYSIEWSKVEEKLSQYEKQ